MLLGFKRQFAPFVEDGSKTHTIRLGRARRPKLGETCHCYVDPRQKTMRLLGRWPCTRVQDFRVQLTIHTINDPPLKMHRYPVGIKMWIADVELSRDEINDFCWRDGFRPVRRCDAWIAFAHYWMDNYKWTSFEGDLIHWKFQ